MQESLDKGTSGLRALWRKKPPEYDVVKGSRTKLISGYWNAYGGLGRER